MNPAPLFMHDDFRQWFSSCRLWALGALWAVTVFTVLTQLNLMLRLCDGTLSLSALTV